jgi:hypothetical protein
VTKQSPFPDSAFSNLDKSLFTNSFQVRPTMDSNEPDLRSKNLEHETSKKKAGPQARLA